MLRHYWNFFVLLVKFHLMIQHMYLSRVIELLHMRFKIFVKIYVLDGSSFNRILKWHTHIRKAPLSSSQFTPKAGGTMTETKVNDEWYYDQLLQEMEELMTFIHS